MKACLIGYNLTNFILAIVLANKNFKVDIVFEKKIKIKQGNRTIGVSKTNIDFFNRSIININKQNNRFNIKLRVFELNFIYLAFLVFISLLISIIKTTKHIFAKKKFK